jgi:UDP-N-acetylmuramoyl-L-alanyl-D-glutamate--2,6-diaminopimelate ligase
VTDAVLTLAQVASVLRAADLLTAIHGAEDVAVSGVAQDSRQVHAGDLFLAWRGVDADGHDYVADATAAGAVAAVVEHELADVAVPQLVVRDGRAAGALVADHVLGSPWKHMDVVGITGTNGKTTTALLLRHLLAAAGPTAAIGTLGVVGPDGEVREGTEGLTTPGPVQLSTWLASLASEGVRALALEASSHALEQRRLDGLRFRVGVFTNLSQDHLDFHGDLARYRRAKLRLVSLLTDDGAAVVNAADRAWDDVRAPRLLRYGQSDLALTTTTDLRADDVRDDTTGSRFRMSYRDQAVTVALPLVGRFNVDNALAAAGAALALGRSLDEVGRRLENAPQVPGRLEVVVRDPFTVIIDFAHTADALANVLATLRPLAGHRLLVLFGAGGDRDRGKRRPMAEAVARHADEVWLTSDNPRTEDPDRILDDLEPGLEGRAFHREVDRRRAIHAAVAEARPGDLLLLAGKGHERYQVVGREKRPFDERVVVRQALAAREVA